MLFLSFTYHRYREDGIIRVYADDRLIDELTLTEDIGYKVVDVTHPPITDHDWIGPHNRTAIMFLPEKNFLFEISEEHLHKKIRIEVQNDHTNHNNGFMTKFAHVNFQQISLFPSSLLYYKNWFKLERFFWDGSEDLTQWDQPPKCFLSGYHQTHRLWSNREQTWCDTLIHQTKGGNFSVDIPLTKKYGIVHLGKVKHGKAYIYLWELVRLWAYKVLNIENEDQRSNNT